MNRQRLDARDMLPSGMEEYLSQNGWHFNKKMMDWAVKQMKPANTAVTPLTKEQVVEMLSRNGVTLENAVGYDCAYVANMAKYDYWGSSIADESHLARFIKDYIDDKDGYDGIAFTRFYADCIGKGLPISWEEVI